MRRLRRGKLLAELKDDGSWLSKNKFFQRSLEFLSKIKRENISPASGDPLSVLFQEVAREIDADDAIDTTVFGKSQTDIVI